MDNTPKDLPVFRLVQGSDEDASGILATSLVNDPAHEVAFIAFSKEHPVELKFAADAMRRNVSGPLIVPDKMIYRNDAKHGPHYVYFSSSDIESIVRKHGKNLRFSNVTVEHAPGLVEGAYMVETWITGANDKAKDLGFDVPQGTWMATMHIENDALWNEVLSGDRTGFSIEGLFAYERAQMSAAPTNEPTEIAVLSILLDANKTDEQKEKDLINLLGPC
jgi:hypothetical protein